MYFILSLFAAKQISSSIHYGDSSIPSAQQSRLLNYLWDRVSAFYTHRNFRFVYNSLFKLISSKVVNGAAVSSRAGNIHSNSVALLHAAGDDIGSSILFPIEFIYDSIHYHNNTQQQSFIDRNNDLVFDYPLIFNSGIFDYHVKSSTVPLVCARVSLPVRTNHVHICSLLPSHISSFYSDPSRCLLSSIERDNCLLKHPKLMFKQSTIGGDRFEYILLVKRMLSLGMLSTTLTPRAVNSIFCVEKDVDCDRLIIDAQLANSYFVPPPYVRLPNPSHLASIKIPFGYKLVKCKSDLSDFYHNLAIPKLLHSMIHQVLIHKLFSSQQAEEEKKLK